MQGGAMEGIILGQNPLPAEIVVLDFHYIQGNIQAQKAITLPFQQPQQFNCNTLMHPNARKVVILLLVLFLLLPVIWIIPYCPKLYAFLSQYYLAGLATSWLGAYVLAILCTPGFAQGSMSPQEYRNSSIKDMVALHLSVMTITFVSLVVIIFLLWVLGWILVLIELAYAWVFHLVFSRLLGI